MLFTKKQQQNSDPNLNPFVEMVAPVMDWMKIIDEYSVEEEVIEKFSQYMDWDSVAMNQKLSDRFIMDHIDVLDMNFIVLYQKVSLSIVEKEIGKIRNGILGKANIYLTEKFMRTYPEKINWNLACIHQDMSEEFIDEMQDYVNWKFISMYQDLSEEFIEKHSDKVDWNDILVCQELSHRFIVKNINRFDPVILDNVYNFKGSSTIPLNLDKPRKMAVNRCQEYYDIAMHDSDGDYTGD